MTKTATFKIDKRCKNVDKYNEVDENGNIIKDSGKQALLGTIYVDRNVAEGEPVIKVTVSTD